jgi:dethiobiotin synthetase
MRTTQGFFIAGTDTGVGKTLVSGALILKFKALNLNVVGFKPVASGTYRDIHGEMRNEDVETLRLASLPTANNLPKTLSLCPYLLDQAVAPHLAAQMQGIDIAGTQIQNAYQALADQFELVIVEGAGGLLVPINAHENLGDVAQAMGLPIVLVVGMRLGCINHALLTYEALLARNLPIAGWVANTLSEQMPLLEKNLESLKNRLSTPFLGLIPALPANLQKLNDAPYSLEALEFAALHLELPRQFR